MSDHDPRQAARESFSGRGLTDAQFEEGYAIAGVLERNIRATGSFHEKLTDYAHAFARSERFDAVKGEAILRDLFKGRFGETMNQMRERLIERESQVKETHREEALTHARQIEPLIRDGDTRPFYQAYDKAALSLADKLDITERGAKEMMKDVYQNAEGRELYETGKALEEKYHTPEREAERRGRTQTLDGTTSRLRTRSR